MFSRNRRTVLPRCLFRSLNTESQAKVYSLDNPLEIRKRARERLAAVERLTPLSPAFYDSFQRRHDYLRISLTEKCNLRCFYCMPSEGTELSPSANILSDDEIVRLAHLFVKNGVVKIRLTGGEPTVRKGIVDLVGRLNELREYGLKSIAMTSNGVALHRKLPTLVRNGLTHLNLSLDTLDPFKFELMTRRMGHEAVLRSLELALGMPGLQSVKLNVVIIRGLNDQEVLKFIELIREQPLSVRFIEFMPFNENKWDKRKMVPSSDLLNRISVALPDVYRVSDEVNDTARSYRIPGYLGSFGFISSMSDHFCATCNRLRLTADGQIKVCLFDSREVSLRDLMRSGASDEELVNVVRAALSVKKEKHAGMEDIDVVHNRPMIKIGDRSRTHALIITTQQTPLFSTSIQFYHRRFVRERVQLKALRHSSSLTTGHRLTHIDKEGKPSMVNVSDKAVTMRSATAQGRIFIPKIAYDLIQNPHGSQEMFDADCELSQRREKTRAKGDVLTVARLAGIMSSKRTSELIPLCHPVPLSHVSVDLSVENNPGNMENSKRYNISCRATVVCEGKTGVEMEALTAVSVSLLTVWDMLKAVAGREMLVDGICVVKKSGGTSGDFVREVDGLVKPR